MMSTATDHADFFRTMWADRMVDQMTFRRLTGRGAINDTTLLYPSEIETTFAQTFALIRPFSGSVIPVEFGQEEQTRIDYIVAVPWDHDELRPDDVGTVDTTVLDPDLVGKLLIVRGVAYGSYRTKTRLACEMALGGGQKV